MLVVGLAVALVVVVSLFVLPLESSATTVAEPFDFELRNGSPYFGHVYKFCAPSGATSAAVVSFTWANTAGENGTFLVLVTGVRPPPTPYVIPYEAANASQGGFSFVASSPIPCAYPISFSWEGGAGGAAVVSGFIIYSSTAVGALF